MPQKEKFLRSGFTLMEVLITVSIIAVILGIVSFMNIKSTLEKGRDSKRKTDLNKLVRVMEDYYNDNGRYPPVNSTPDGKIKDAPWGSAFSTYVPALPKDPSSLSQEYYYFSDPANGNSYSIFSKLENTKDADIVVVGCENGCGPNLAYNYVVHSSNVVMLAGLPNGEPIPIGQEEEPSATPTWTCGDPLTIAHTAGDVAPVNKTITYGTVLTNIGGTGDKCWITQNLGADRRAVSATDGTEESAGWYWQFNRKQGYKHDGLTRTPNYAWINSISEHLDWEAANDPCIMLLTGWRLPTIAEWTIADGAPQNWTNYNEAYASVLKLHTGGYLWKNNGVRFQMGWSGWYWSSTTHINASYGFYMNVSDHDSKTEYENKGNAFSVRCIKD